MKDYSDEKKLNIIICVLLGVIALNFIIGTIVNIVSGITDWLEFILRAVAAVLAVVCFCRRVYIIKTYL